MGAAGYNFQQSLNRFKRPNYGYDPKLRADTLSGLRSNAYTAGTGFVNQARRASPVRSAGVLNLFKQGANLQGDIYQRAALPFAAQEAQFGEGQRQSDIGNALSLFRSVEERQKFDEEMKKRYGFSFGDLLGNVLGAGAQVGSAYATR